MQRSALGIGHRGQLEEEPAGEEHERGKPAGVQRDNPEGEVHRADRGRVNDREQRAIAEGALGHLWDARRVTSRGLGTEDRGGRLRQR